MKRQQEQKNQSTRKRRKGSKRFKSFMKNKLYVASILVVLALVLLGVRLIWIAYTNGDKYTKQILSQQTYESTTLPYKRGDILDANGTRLAVSVKQYNIIIDSYVMTYKDEYIEPSLEALANCFPEVDMEAVRKHIYDNKAKDIADRARYYKPLKTLVTYEQMIAYEDYKDKKNAEFAAIEGNKAKIDGVWFEAEYQRVYPYGSLACDVIGHAGRKNMGAYGLEEYYNDILNGINGRTYGYLGDEEVKERTVKEPVEGYNIHSTIDMNIQSIVEKYLHKFNEENKNTVKEGNGAENVGCIIMEVNTGNVLAMANYPDFDINDYENPQNLLGDVLLDENGKRTGRFITQADLEAMNEDMLNMHRNALWQNFCVAETYEPGSTAKPFTVATALESGAITGNEVYQCNGKLHIGGHDIHCHVRSGEGAVDVQSSIAWSCNVSMMHMGQAIGKSNFVKFQQLFNFGLKTNVDLAGEARTVDLVYGADMGDADLATNTFGQNFNVTMIQMITGYCSLINGGYYYEPHLVDKITDYNGNVVKNIEPRVLRQTVSAATSEKIRQYCRAVVMPEGGSQRTGKTARPAGYAIGGKTGTAQTQPRDAKEYVVSFIGYAPADDPQIAIYVVVDRANAARQDDAKFATRIVRNVLTEVLPYLNIYMTEELSDAEIAELEALKLENTYGKNQEAEQEEVTDETTNTGTTQYPEPEWKSYAKDPATGYLKDPVTGALLDPETGEVVVGESIPAIDW